MILKSLQNEIFRRYSKHGFKFKNWEELLIKTKLNPNKKVTCYYCNKLLTSDFKKNKYDVVSLDHKQSKHFGGLNNLDNVCLCCAECNIIKGTMNSQTYFMFLNCLKEAGIKEIIFKEIYPGKRANMLARKNKKKLWEFM